MKISDLAALVAVRNHISVIINDKNLTTRDEVGKLQEARHKLDKIFTKALLEESVDALLPHELTIVKVGGNGYTPTEADLKVWRKIFEDSKNDPDFKIFTHDAVSVTQLEVGPNSEVRVCPAVEPRTIQVSPNVSITQRGQLSLPLGKEVKSTKLEREAVKQLIESVKNSSEKDDSENCAEVARGDTGESEIELGADAISNLKAAVKEVEKLGIKPEHLEGGGRSGDLDTTKKQVVAAVEDIAQGDIDKLEEGLDKLEEQGVKITPAVVEEVAKPIKAPEEKKRKISKKTRKPGKGVEEDPEFQAALKREKEALKKEGRSNQKVKRANDKEQG